jgi:hypothetical protein
MKRLLLLVLAACSDPVHERMVTALGPEPNGGTPSALHRPGQPCLVCHGGDGPAEGRLVFGGTIYTTPSGPALVGALVTMTDARGRVFRAPTNLAGNFYVSEGTPEYPVRVSLDYLDIRQSMSTFANEGSCATCHSVPGGPGPVWVSP